MEFQLEAPFEPTGDQPQAIETLSAQLLHGKKHQVLMGSCAPPPSEQGVSNERLDS